MESEDIFIFYREEIDSDFAVVWTQILQNPNYSDSCDVRIDCFDGNYCHSHQSLLSVSSVCFREAFEHFYNNNERQQRPLNEELVITLPQFIGCQELMSIINYIYIGFVSIPESRVSQFLEASKFLSINGLKDIVLVFEDEIHNYEEVMTSEDLTQIKKRPKFEIESNECIEKRNSCEISGNTCFPSLKEFSKEALITRTANLVKKKYSTMVSTTRRVSFHGRRPQIGSPLITEDFKFGDRYQCKVCLRTYSWKKSLVNYKVLHPEDVEVVS